MSRGPEHTRADWWADKLRAAGWWVQKLPASSMAGLPDYRVGRPGDGARFVEAKADDAGGFDAGEVTLSQQFFLERERRAGAMASVVVLAQDFFVELLWPCTQNIPARVLRVLGERYQ